MGWVLKISSADSAEDSQSNPSMTEKRGKGCSEARKECLTVLGNAPARSPSRNQRDGDRAATVREWFRQKSPKRLSTRAEEMNLGFFRTWALARLLRGRQRPPARSRHCGTITFHPGFPTLFDPSPPEILGTARSAVVVHRGPLPVESFSQMRPGTPFWSRSSAPLALHAGTPLALRNAHPMYAAPPRPAVVIHDDLAGRIVLPDQIRHAIAVEIGRSHDGPTGISGFVESSPTLASCAIRCAVIHYGDLPRRVVLPDQIRHAVLIEAGGSHDMPTPI